MTDPEAMIHQTFTATSEDTRTLVPHFPYINLEVFSALLEIIFETLVACLLGVVLTEIDSFLVLPPFISLPLDFVSSEWLSPVCLGTPSHQPGALAPRLQGYRTIGESEYLSELWEFFVSFFQHFYMFKVISKSKERFR